MISGKSSPRRLRTLSFLCLICLLSLPYLISAGEVKYRYDSQDRLVSATFANSTVTYSYDKTGNIVSVKSGPTNSSE